MQKLVRFWMVRGYRDPITKQVLYLRKFVDTGRYYLSTIKRSDEDESTQPKYDDYLIPATAADGSLIWVPEK